ncbi:hypothetical protein [Larkinella punicea]|nr:hypothetical protein [Larkinella punicea]
MNRTIPVLMSLALTLLIASCKHEQEMINPGVPDYTADPPQQRPGKVYPVGSPLGTATTVTIGPAGGQLTSSDERLTITVPAGAVETSQAFGIQPIGSTGPQALGSGFRLSPHGKTFKKPVTISVRYDPTSLSGTVAEALALAYQNDKGVWMLAAKGKVDTVAHTVHVETTHFSDWAMLQRAKLLPEVGFVKPGGNLGLEVIVLDDRAFIPLDTDTEVPAPYQSPTQLVDVSTWNLAGSGTLTPAIWKASYQAPSAVPARNPVAVSIKLKGPTTIDGKLFKALWLVSNIYIGEEGITFRINGGKWIHTLANAHMLSNQGLRLLEMTGGVTAEGNNWGVNIHTNQPPLETEESLVTTLAGMTMPWSVDASGPLFHLSDDNGKVYYKHFYAVPPVFYPSPGALTFYQFGKTGDYIVGKFEMQKAGMYNDTKGYLGTARIEGFFRVKRSR